MGGWSGASAPDCPSRQIGRTSCARFDWLPDWDRNGRRFGDLARFARLHFPDWKDLYFCQIARLHYFPDCQIAPPARFQIVFEAQRLARLPPLVERHASCQIGTRAGLVSSVIPCPKAILPDCHEEDICRQISWPPDLPDWNKRQISQIGAARLPPDYLKVPRIEQPSMIPSL